MFYIHYEDPQFSEPPWPGYRRSGGYLTVEEAVEQAASDVLTGYGIPVGIFEEGISEMMNEGDADTPSNSLKGLKKTQYAATKERVLKRADELRSNEEKLRTDRVIFDADTIRAGLKTILPPGVDVEEVMKIVKVES